MKLKSTTYYWLAVVFGGVGMGAAMGAEDRERAAKRRKYGKINRTHARNPEYPENQERGA